MALSCSFELLSCEAEGKGVLDTHGSLCAATGKFSSNLAVRKHRLAEFGEMVCNSEWDDVLRNKI